MRFGLAVIAFLCGSCAVPPPGSTPGQATELSGRTAGPAQRCVIIQPSEALRIADGDRHTLIYGTGRTIWANHLGSCGFGLDDALVTEPIGSHYCGGDVVHSFDRFSKIPGPACVLGDFVPYSR